MRSVEDDRPVIIRIRGSVSMSRPTRRLTLTGGTGLALAALLPGAAAYAGSSDPPGNNGTVKANADTAVSTSNDPHVGCVFQIDMFGLDDGTSSATIRFDVVSPSGSGLIRQDLVVVDGNGAGGSLDGYAGSADYSLVGMMGAYTAHPDQGYHVRLTVDTDGSQGNSKKFKVFWVTGCEAPPPPPPPPPPEL